MILALCLTLFSLAEDKPKDYYAILNSNRDDDVEVIKKRFRKLAFENHPDRNPNQPEKLELFKDIGEAWSILSDPTLRARYDREGSKGFSSADGFHTSSHRLEEIVEFLYPVLGRSFKRYGNTLAKFKTDQQIAALKAATQARGDRVRHDLDVLLKFNQWPQVNALKATAPYRRGNVVRDYEELLTFDNDLSVEALGHLFEAIGDKAAYRFEEAKRFTQPQAVRALEVAAEARGEAVFHDMNELLKFTTPQQVDALKAVAPHRGTAVNRDYEEIRRFEDHTQLLALRIAAALRKNKIYSDYDSLLQVKTPGQGFALSLVGIQRGGALNQSYGDVLKFSTESHRRAMVLFTETLLAREGLEGDWAILFPMEENQVIIRKALKRIGFSGLLDDLASVDNPQELNRFRELLEEGVELPDAVSRVRSGAVMRHSEHIGQLAREAKDLSELRTIIYRETLADPGTQTKAVRRFVEQFPALVAERARDLKDLQIFANLNGGDLDQLTTKYCKAKVRSAEDLRAHLPQLGGLDKSVRSGLMNHVEANLLDFFDPSLTTKEWIQLFGRVPETPNSLIEAVAARIDNFNDLLLFIDALEDYPQGPLLDKAVARLTTTPEEFEKLAKLQPFEDFDNFAKLTTAYHSRFDSLQSLVQEAWNVKTPFPEDYPLLREFRAFDLIPEAAFFELKGLLTSGPLLRETRAMTILHAISKAPNLEELKSIGMTWREWLTTRPMRQTYSAQKRNLGHRTFLQRCMDGLLRAVGRSR